MQPYIVGFIFARGGSKGLPRKNVLPLAGKPLLAHAVEAAQASRWISRVVVSTDDPEIAEIARRCGADVPFVRPPEFSGDKSPECLAWLHALDTVEQLDGRRIDTFVSVPATAPLRTSEDVDAVIEALRSSDADVAVTVSESRRNPYFSMVNIHDDGIARVVMGKEHAVLRRQDAPVCYDLVPSAYAATPEFVRRGVSVLQARLKAVPIPADRAVDIDDELDLEIAELLLRRRIRAESAVTLPLRRAG